MQYENGFQSHLNLIFEMLNLDHSKPDKVIGDQFKENIRNFLSAHSEVDALPTKELNTRLLLLFQALGNPRVSINT